MKEDILKRCEELGLNQKESDLLVDLLGWNIGATGQAPPLSHRGLRVYSDLPWHESYVCDRITSLCEKLLGSYLFEVKADPDKFFHDYYTHKRGSRGVGVLLHQLGINSSIEDYSFIFYAAPELLYKSFIKLLAFLLSPIKEKR